MIHLWIYSQFTLKGVHTRKPRPGPFPWPWNPWDWRKLSQVKVTCLLTRQGFSASFQPNAFGWWLNFQKSLCNSTSCSIYDCALILHASKAQFWQKKKSLFLCFKVMQPSRISGLFPEVSSGFGPVTCSPTVDTAAKLTLSICTLREKNERALKKNKPLVFYFIYLSFLFLQNGSGTIHPLCAFYWYCFKRAIFLCPGIVCRDRTCP